MKENILEQIKNYFHVWEDYSGPENDQKTHIVGLEQQFLPDTKEQAVNIRRNQEMVKKFLDRLYTVDSVSEILSENLEEVKLDSHHLKQLGRYKDRKIELDYGLSASESKKFVYMWLHELGHALTIKDLSDKREQARGNENLGGKLFGISEFAADLAAVEMIGKNNFFEIADFMMGNKEWLEEEYGNVRELLSRLEYIRNNYDEWIKSINEFWRLPFSLSDKDKKELWDIYKEISKNFKVEFTKDENAWDDD